MLIPTIIIDRVENITEDVFHEVHISSLGGFMTCAYREFNEKSTRLNKDGEIKDYFYEGDVTEQLITAYCYGAKLGDDLLYNHFANSMEFPKWNRLKKHAENFKRDYIKTEMGDRYPLFTQKKMVIHIHMNPYIFVLSGTPDIIWNDYHISDIKTSKSKWDVKKPEFEIQCRGYPWMLKVITRHPLLMKDDKYTFEYKVFTKPLKNDPQFQLLKYEGSYMESQQLIFYLLDCYKKALIHGPLPKKNLWCTKGCTLKKSCPLRVNLSDKF